uniref:EF-hand domain-containing protein n=1 Tax=Parastrongyloides trichosuri TaxID=131310 RepID=A0A0N4ZTD2_PARTI
MKILIIFIFITFLKTFGHEFGKDDSIHDKEHLKEHLQDTIDIDTAHMTADQERYHYFRLHDTNKDNLIDGMEIMKAYTHHDHRMDGTKPVLQDYQIENLVDAVLQEMDKNNDGFITYAEYVAKTMPGKS